MRETGPLCRRDLRKILERPQADLASATRKGRRGRETRQPTGRWAKARPPRRRTMPRWPLDSGRGRAAQEALREGRPSLGVPPVALPSSENFPPEAFVQSLHFPQPLAALRRSPARLWRGSGARSAPLCRSRSALQLRTPVRQSSAAVQSGRPGRRRARSRGCEVTAAGGRRTVANGKGGNDMMASVAGRVSRRGDPRGRAWPTTPHEAAAPSGRH